LVFSLYFFGASLLLLGAFSDCCLSRCSGADRVLDGHEVAGVDVVLLLNLRERQILISAKVKVQLLEADEGMEHLRAVGARSFSG